MQPRRKTAKGTLAVSPRQAGMVAISSTDAPSGSEDCWAPRRASGRALHSYLSAKRTKTQLETPTRRHEAVVYVLPLAELSRWLGEMDAGA